jgi:hypothetical protein
LRDLARGLIPISTEHSRVTSPTPRHRAVEFPASGPRLLGTILRALTRRRLNHSDHETNRGVRSDRTETILSQQRLRRRWIDGVELAYIGCAGATSSSRPLCERVNDLLRHGGGHLTSKGPHKSGERVWQCRDWESFTLAWPERADQMALVLDWSRGHHDRGDRVGDDFLLRRRRYPATLPPSSQLAEKLGATTMQLLSGLPGVQLAPLRHGPRLIRPVLARVRRRSRHAVDVEERSSMSKPS